jgi:hypothetical protein
VNNSCFTSTSPFVAITEPLRLGPARRFNTLYQKDGFPVLMFFFFFHFLFESRVNYQSIRGAVFLVRFRNIMLLRRTGSRRWSCFYSREPLYRLDIGRNRRSSSSSQTVANRTGRVYRAANPRNDIGSDGIKEYDAVVIGGGLVGVSISRLLAQRNVKVCVVEKAHDLGEGASKSNSAIIHTGTGSRLWTPYSVSIM